MQEFMKGFPWAWGPQTPGGRPKFGLGTVFGIILTFFIALTMLWIIVFGDGTKTAEWTGYEEIEQFWICPSIAESKVENGRFLDEMYQIEPEWIADGGHRAFPEQIIDVPADYCLGAPPPKVLRIRTCEDSFEANPGQRMFCKSGEAGLTIRVKQPNELHAGFDMMLSPTRPRCIVAHEFGHAYWGFNGEHSTKATNIMYEGLHSINTEGNSTFESCGTSREGLTKP